MIRRVLGVAALLVLTCACKGENTAGGAGEAAVATGPTVQDVVEGRKIYLTYGCVGCHGVTGGGGMGKPILDDQWIFGSDDATLFKLIRGEVPKQTMPNAIGKVLTDDQIKQVILYVRHIYKGDPAKINWTPPPAVPDELMQGPVSTGDPVAAGKVLFMAACVPCHGEAGKGDGVAAKDLNPKPRNLTDGAYIGKLDDRYLYELISRGGIAVGKSPQMPEFGLSPQDIQNVIAFVRTLSSGAVVNASAPAPAPAPPPGG
ncbi:MAG TPA: c-type cytochrome [Polyangiaceae bacterium]|nr:c-type cytochrome [Polyangiaceae bacterium]